MTDLEQLGACVRRAVRRELRRNGMYVPYASKVVAPKKAKRCQQCGK